MRITIRIGSREAFHRLAPTSPLSTHGNVFIDAPAKSHKTLFVLPVKIGDKPLKRLDSWKEVRFGFRSAGFGFRSRRALISFRLVLISFRRILNSFSASWRMERARRGVAALRFLLPRNLENPSSRRSAALSTIGTLRPRGQRQAAGRCASGQLPPCLRFGLLAEHLRRPVLRERLPHQVLMALGRRAADRRIAVEVGRKGVALR